MSTVKCCISRQVNVGLRNKFQREETIKINLFCIEVYFWSTYFASKAKANTPAASGAAALVPECVVVHFPYKSVVATPVFGSFAPLLNVLANVELPVLLCHTNKSKLFKMRIKTFN